MTMNLELGKYTSLNLNTKNEGRKIMLKSKRIMAFIVTLVFVFSMVTSATLATSSEKVSLGSNETKMQNQIVVNNMDMDHATAIDEKDEVDNRPEQDAMNEQVSDNSIFKIPEIAGGIGQDQDDALLQIEDSEKKLKQERMEKDKTTRFIIKYKDSASIGALSSSTMQKLNAKQQTKKQVSKKQKTAEKGGKENLYQKTYATVAIVELNEKIDKKHFEEVVQANEDMNEIEYVQPDYELKLSDLAADSVEQQEPNNQQSQQTDTNVDNTVEKNAPESTADPSEISSTVVKATETTSLNAFDIDTNLNAAFQQSTGEGVVIALIDTAVDITHNQLNGHLVDGWDFVNDQTLVFDPNSSITENHGTHVAGIIAKSAPNAQIMPLKVFENGSAYTSDILEAIEYAEENGATIVNCSWGCADDNLILKEVIENSNMFFVAAAGNNRMNIDEKGIYPAAYNLDNVISVGAINDDGGLSYFSNYGTTNVNITAWGREVESLLPNNKTGAMTGTSMAAGFITGAAALARANGTENLKERLMNTADKLSCLANKTTSGNMVNFNNAVNNITGSSLVITPAEDFDVLGYQRTPQENWELFSSLDNIQVSSGETHSMSLKSNDTVWAWGDNYDGTLGDGTNVDSLVPVQVVGLTDVKQIVASHYHSYALKNDGTVWTWGENDIFGIYSNVPMQISGLSDVKKIAASNYIFAAIFNNNSMTTWDCITAFDSASLSNIMDVTVGLDYCLAVTTVGTVYAWGRNGYGQLGLGHTNNVTTPTLIPSLTNITSVSSYNRSSLAIRSDKRVFSWGSNINGQLGLGDTVDKISPVMINSLANVNSVSSGARHSLAITEDGNLWTWGLNVQGQLGDGTMINKSLPVRALKFSPVNKAISISAGDNHSLVISEESFIYSFGSNYYGELGNGTTINNPIPGQVSGGLDYLDVHPINEGELIHSSLVTPTETNQFSFTPAEDTYYTIKLYADFPIHVYLRMLSGGGEDIIDAGDNSINGSIEFFDNLYSSSEYRVEVTSVGSEIGDYSLIYQKATKEYSNVAVGSYHTLALSNDGTVWAWGNNQYGQLGRNNKINSNVPAQVLQSENGIITPITNVSNIAAGQLCSFAVKADGTVWAWGCNVYGQLGDGTTVDKSVAIKINGLSNIIKISAAADHVLALSNQASGNQVYSWGKNEFGQLGLGHANSQFNTPQLVRDENNNLLNNVSDVSVGAYYSTAIKGGAVYTWGYNEYGQLGRASDPSLNYSTRVTSISGLANITKISAANLHVLALNSSGNVYQWGATYVTCIGWAWYIQQTTTTPQSLGLTNVTKISAGQGHNMIVKSDNTIWVWGDNYYGQLGVNNNNYIYGPTELTQFHGCGYGVGAGVANSVVMSSNLYATGYNFHGELGDGTNINTNYFRMVKEQQRESYLGNWQIDAINGEDYYITVALNDINLSGSDILELEYDKDTVNIVDLSAIVNGSYNTAWTSNVLTNDNIQIIESVPGRIKFKILQPAGSTWSGITNVIKINAIKTGLCGIKLTVN